MLAVFFHPSPVLVFDTESHIEPGTHGFNQAGWLSLDYFISFSVWIQQFSGFFIFYHLKEICGFNTEVSFYLYYMWILRKKSWIIIAFLGTITVYVTIIYIISFVFIFVNRLCHFSYELFLITKITFYSQSLSSKITNWFHPKQYQLHFP